jgi:hypothetical protein
MATRIIFQGYGSQDLKLTIYPLLALRLRINGAIPLLPPNAFMVWTGTTSPFTFLISTLLHTNASERGVHLIGHAQATKKGMKQ